MYVLFWCLAGYSFSFAFLHFKDVLQVQDQPGRSTWYILPSVMAAVLMNIPRSSMIIMIWWWWWWWYDDDDEDVIHLQFTCCRASWLWSLWISQGHHQLKVWGIEKPRLVASLCTWVVQYSPNLPYTLSRPPITMIIKCIFRCASISRLYPRQ